MGFVKAGLRLINIDQVVEVDVFPALSERVEFDEETGEEFTADGCPLTVRLVTTATAMRSEFVGYEDTNPVSGSEAYVITIRGSEAEEFLGSIRYREAASQFEPYATQILKERGRA